MEINEESLRICHFCGKKVLNLGSHIANMHPKIMEKLSEMDSFAQPDTQKSAAGPAFAPQKQGLAALIQEKLDIMLNIKIIEMLSKSPETSLQEISKAINPPPPPQQIGIKEIKEYHDMIYQDKEPPYIETGNQWVDIAQQGLPILKDLIASRRQPKPEVIKQYVRTGKETDTGILKPIQLEIAGDPAKPGSDSKEPGTISQAE